MRLRLMPIEFGCICLLLFFGMQGYVPILMPNMGGALTSQAQMNQTHGISHVILVLVWGGIFFFLLKSHFHLRLDLISSRVALGYVVFAAFSTLWSSQPASSFSGSVSLGISTVFAIFLVTRFPGERLPVLLSWMMLFLALGSAVFALLLPSHGIDHMAHSGAWNGVFNQKNSLGQVMVFGCGIALALPNGNFVERLWKYGILFLCLAEVGLSRSREAWIVCAIVLFVHYLLNFYTRFAMASRKTVLALGLLIIAIGGAASAALSVIILKAFGRDITLTGRTVLWQAVLEQCKNHPLAGYGLGAFWGTGDSFPIYATTHWLPTSAHNGFLECQLELGVLGLILLLWLMLMALRSVSRIITTQPQFDSSRVWIYSLLSISILNTVGDITGIINSISWLLLICSACGLEENARQGASSSHSPVNQFPPAAARMRVASPARAQGILNI